MYIYLRIYINKLTLISSMNSPQTHPNLPQHLLSNTLQPQLSPYRYVNLIIFILACLVNSLPIQTFSSINTQVQNQYRYSAEIITFTILLGPILHTIMATPCNYMLDKYGIKIGCSVGGVIVILGVWVRVLLIQNNPFFMLLGSVLSAAGYVMVISSPSAFAIKWFPSQTVPKIIATCVFFNFISSGGGAALGGIVLPQNADATDIKNFLIVQAIIISIIFILFIILYREAPQNPPSISAAALQHQNQIPIKINQQKYNSLSYPQQNQQIPNTQASYPKKQPYIYTIKKLLKNKSYMLSILSLSLSYGTFVSFMSVLDQSLAVLGFSKPDKIASVTIASAIVVGIFGLFVFVRAIRQTLRYKFIISLNLLGTLITFIMLSLTYCLKVESFVIVGIVSGCIGFFAMTTPALFTAYTTELSFPEGQGSATGFLFAGSHFFGFVNGMIWVAIIDKTNKLKVYLMYAVFCIFGLLSLLTHVYAQQNLNKTNFQRGIIKKQQESFHHNQSQDQNKQI